MARGLVSQYPHGKNTSACLTDRNHSNLGYKRDDPATIHEDYLPVISEKGMVFGYGEMDRETFVLRNLLTINRRRTREMGLGSPPGTWRCRRIREGPPDGRPCGQLRHCQSLIPQPQRSPAQQAMGSPRPRSHKGGLPLSSRSCQPPPQRSRGWWTHRLQGRTPPFRGVPQGVHRRAQDLGLDKRVVRLLRGRLEVARGQRLQVGEGVHGARRPRRLGQPHSSLQRQPF